MTPVLGKDGTLTSCLVVLQSFFGRRLAETLAASLRKYRLCQADPCLRTKSKTGKLKRKDAEGTARMRLLLSNQSSAVGKSPKANPGVRRHAQGRLQHLPHLPCREARSGAGWSSSDEGPRAGDSACNSGLTWLAHPQLGGSAGEGRGGLPPPPWAVAPFLASGPLPFP